MTALECVVSFFSLVSEYNSRWRLCLWVHTWKMAASYCYFLLAIFDLGILFDLGMGEESAS